MAALGLGLALLPAGCGSDRADQPGDPFASGRFHPVEAQGAGAAFLYRLPGGRLALRFDLRTSAYPGLAVWISRAADPQTTPRIATAPHFALAPLKATRGTQNYILPARLDRAAVGSVVIWRAETKMGYAAAPLR